MRVFDPSTRTPLRMFKGHTKAVRCLAFGSGNGHILSGGDDGCLRLWDVATEQCVTTVQQAHGDYVRCCSRCRPLPLTSLQFFGYVTRSAAAAHHLTCTPRAATTTSPSCGTCVQVSQRSHVELEVHGWNQSGPLLLYRRHNCHERPHCIQGALRAAVGRTQHAISRQNADVWAVTQRNAADGGC